MQFHDLIIGLCVGVIFATLVTVITNRNEVNSCSVIISGESIKVLNCDLNPEMLREISKLKVFNHNLGRY
ncbi:TGB3 [Garlic yellow stripe associated virus]|nr:TGB3 [Garlic yellow stripe associated virus]